MNLYIIYIGGKLVIGIPFYEIAQQNLFLIGVVLCLLIGLYSPILLSTSSILHLFFLLLIS